MLIREPVKIKVPNYLIYIGLLILISIIINLFSLLLLIFSNLQLPNIRIKHNDILNIVVIAPLIEEFCFRAVLKKNIKNLLFFSIGLMGIVLRHLSVNSIYIVTCMFFLVIIVIIFFKTKNHLLYLNPYKKTQILILVYSSSLMFGLAHLIGIDYFSMSYVFLIIYVFPKILAGFLLSMIRLKFGLFHSIIFHAFINLIIYFITI